MLKVKRFQSIKEVLEEDEVLIDTHCFNELGRLQVRKGTIPQLLVSVLYSFFGSRPFSIFCLGSIPLVREPSIAVLVLAKKTPIRFKDGGLWKE